MLFIFNMESFWRAYENPFFHSRLILMSIELESWKRTKTPLIISRSSWGSQIYSNLNNNEKIIKSFLNSKEVGIEKWDFYVHGEWKFRTAGTAYANKACRSAKTEQLKFYQITKKIEKKVEKKIFFAKINQKEREFKSEFYKRKLIVRILTQNGLEMQS